MIALRVSPRYSDSACLERVSSIKSTYDFKFKQHSSSMPRLEPWIVPLLVEALARKQQARWGRSPHQLALRLSGLCAFLMNLKVGWLLGGIKIKSVIFVLLAVERVLMWTSLVNKMRGYYIEISENKLCQELTWDILGDTHVLVFCFSRKINCKPIILHRKDTGLGAKTSKGSLSREIYFLSMSQNS